MRVFTVLLVDDDPDVRELCGAALREAGFVVEEAATIACALDHLRIARSPDLAILDRDLPDGDGFVIAAALRGDSDSSVRFLAFTAHAEREARRAAAAAGCASFLAKPCAPAALVAAVRLALGGDVTPSSRCG